MWLSRSVCYHHLIEEVVTPKLWVVLFSKMKGRQARFDQTSRISLAVTKQSTWFVRWLVVKAYQQNNAWGWTWSVSMWYRVDLDFGCMDCHKVPCCCPMEGIPSWSMPWLCSKQNMDDLEQTHLFLWNLGMAMVRIMRLQSKTSCTILLNYGLNTDCIYNIHISSHSCFCFLEVLTTLCNRVELAHCLGEPSSLMRLSINSPMNGQMFVVLYL